MTAYTDVQKGWSLPADMAPYVITDHALEQFNRRIGRRVNLDVARHEFLLRLSRATTSKRQPSWVRGKRSETAWVFDDQIACPVDSDFAIKTCLTRFDGEPVGASVRWGKPLPRRMGATGQDPGPAAVEKQAPPHTPGGVSPTPSGARGAR